MEDPAHFAHDQSFGIIISLWILVFVSCFPIVRPPVGPNMSGEFWPPQIPQPHELYGQTFHFHTITSPSSESNAGIQQGNLDVRGLTSSHHESRIRTLPDLSSCACEIRVSIFTIHQFRPTTELNGLIEHVKRRSRMHLLQRVHLS
jgi:hypothetical protein